MIPEIILLVADASTDSIVGLTREGRAVPVFDPAPVLPGVQAMTRAEDGRLYVACARSNQVLCLSPAGSVLAAYEDSALRNPKSLDMDLAGSLYVTSWDGNALIKFDAAGKVVGRAEIQTPHGVFLSRKVSGQRFVGVTQEGSTRISVFAAADLSYITNQDLGASMAAMLNSESIAPTLVYMADSANGSVVTYADHTREFHKQETFRVGFDPFALAETAEGIFLCCAATGEVWIQKCQSAPFELFSRGSIGKPTAATTALGISLEPDSRLQNRSESETRSLSV